MKKKKNKKINKKYALLVILFCIVIFICIVLNTNNNEEFKIESRVNNIKKESDNDKYETIGWIRVQGTNIDYPVIVFKDNVDDSASVKKESFALSKGSEEKFFNQMTIIGHNIYNLGSKPKKQSDKFKRFEELMSFVYYDFAKENQYIQYTIDGKNYKYKIFAVTLLGPVDYIFKLNSTDVSNEENKESIDYLKKNSIYDYKIDVNSNDNIIHVTTCTRMFGEENKKSLVVSGKLVKNNDKTYSKVSKSDKYKEIEEKLSGGKENEEDI